MSALSASSFVMDGHYPLSVDSINRLWTRSSDSRWMTPWQVINEALQHKKPARNMTWLAEQLDEDIRVVSNWKKRGVPARRYREIASVVGLSVDQIEGLAPLPWDKPPVSDGLLPEVAQLAQAINDLPEPQRGSFIKMTATTLSFLPNLHRPTTESAQPKQEPSPERAKKLR